MPKKQNSLTPEEQRKLFEAEVRRQKKAGDFDHGAADEALDALVLRSRNLGDVASD